MKEVARYTGKVLLLNTPPQASSVTLTEVKSGNSIETQAVTDTLLRANLKTGDEFEIIIEQSMTGLTSGRIIKSSSNQETDFDI